MKSIRNNVQTLVVVSMITFISIQILPAQNLTPVKMEDKWGFADDAGKVIIDAQYLEVEKFADEITGVKIALAKWILIDKTGKQVTDQTYSRIYGFQNGLAIVNPIVQNDFSDHYAFIDNTGKQVSETYQYVGSFSEGMAMVRKNNKFGYIDTTMKLVIPANYDNADDFSEGVAAVNMGGTGATYPWTIDGGKWGYISKTGDLVIPFQYDWCSKFKDGEATAELKKKRFKINMAGEKIQ